MGCRWAVSVFDVRVNKCERARHRLQRGVIKLPVRVLIVLFMEASLFSVNAPFQCFFSLVSSFQSYTFIYLLIFFFYFHFRLLLYVGSVFRSFYIFNYAGISLTIDNYLLCFPRQTNFQRILKIYSQFHFLIWIQVHCNSFWFGWICFGLVIANSIIYR